MVHFIVGKNALGKTSTLWNMYEVEMQKDGYGRVVSNLDERPVFSSIKLDSDLLNVTEEILAASEIIISRNNIIGVDCGDDGDKGTTQYCNILTYLLKVSNKIYLDEPELGLEPVEVRNVARVLNYINNSCDKEVWITTHSASMVAVYGSDLYTIVNGKVVKGDYNTLYEGLNQM